MEAIDNMMYSDQVRDHLSSYFTEIWNSDATFLIQRTKLDDHD